jgi:hypothetical protein
VQKTGIFRDNYPSPNRVNSNGVSYAGKNAFETNTSYFQDLCPQPFYLEVLHHIAKNEGCFDAVNSYDKAIFHLVFCNLRVHKLQARFCRKSLIDSNNEMNMPSMTALVSMAWI